MSDGLVLTIAGIWIGCQIFKGNAFKRLGIAQ